MEFKTEQAKINYYKAKKRSHITLSNKHRSLYEASPNFCKTCNKKIFYEKRENVFCNRSCSGSYNNRKRGPRNKETRRKISLALGGTGELSSGLCLNCNKVLDRSQKKFCCFKCQNVCLYETFIVSWKEGKENGVRGKSGTSSYIKRYLIETRGEKCEECAWCEINIYTKRIPIHLHHIDGDYTNNTEENLKILCPNCHSLTNNYCSRNKGNNKRTHR